MKFRYYILSTFEGEYTGTNSREIALNHAASEDFFVLDTLDGTTLDTHAVPHPVKEQKE